MSNQCNVIKDILPLYAENMVSTDTGEFVREHLGHCESCRAELAHMRKPADFIPDAAIVPLKRIKKELLMKHLQTIFFTAMLACSIAAVAFGILTAPDFFPYSDSLVKVMEDSDANIIIAFDDKVAGYNCIKEFRSETETEVYRINAWTTAWDAYSSNRGEQNMVIPMEKETKIRIFYAQNNGSEDVLIYGVNEDMEGNSVTLPRLVLLPYFLSAILALAMLMILRLSFRNKQAVTVWIDRSIPFPISYMAAQLCTKGMNFTTYSLQRDFCIILLAAMLLYFAMLAGKSLYQAKMGTYLHPL